jgi:hypothetical protein
MEYNIQEAERLQDALHSCPALSAQLGLQGLACLAACSRTLKDACNNRVCRDAQSLLQPLVQQGAQLQEQHKHAAVWLMKLLHRAPNKATVAEVEELLVFVPIMGLYWALQLVSAGVHISCAQLLAAADSMVAGVEVWVQAQQQLKMKSDMPPAAYTICCSSKWVSQAAHGQCFTWYLLSKLVGATSAALHLCCQQCDRTIEHIQALKVLHISRPAPRTKCLGCGCCCYVQGRLKLPPEHANSLLQLAMNCSRPATAAAAARRLPGNPQPEFTRKLLLTAVARQHTEVLKGMSKLAAVLQHVDVPTLEPVLGFLVGEGEGECITPLLGLPVASQLPSDAVCRLLLTAALYGAQECAVQLCKLAGAQQMSCQDLEGLLIACVSEKVNASSTDWGNLHDVRCMFCMKSIFALPAAQRLSCSAILQLVRSYHEVCSAGVTHTFGIFVEGVHSLRSLPAAEELSSQSTVQQLLAAVQQGDALTVKSLMYMPATQGISREQLLQLLTAITKDPCWRNHACVELLCHLPAAQDLSSEEAAALLLAALHQGKTECINHLCKLPAAQRLRSEEVARLLLTALHQGQAKCMAALRKLPAVDSLSSETVSQLLCAGVEIHDRIHTELLLSLPPGVELSSSRLVQHLQETRHYECIKWLLRLSAAEVQLSTEQTAEVLKLAVVWSCIDIVMQLCALPAASLLSSSQVAAAIEAAVMQGSEECIQLLCRLPAAQQLNKKEVRWLLASAEQFGSNACIAMLRRLPARR